MIIEIESIFEKNIDLISHECWKIRINSNNVIHRWDNLVNYSWGIRTGVLAKSIRASLFPNHFLIYIHVTHLLNRGRATV